MPTVKKWARKPRAKPVRKNNLGGAVGRIAPVVSSELPPVRMNLYGRSGTGKTTLACTFPKPLLHIVCSAIGLGESLSIRGVKDVHDVELHSSEEVVQLAELVARERNYVTVVLDHATGLQDLVLREIMGITELPVQKSWGMASREQYGQCAMKTKEYLRKLLSLGCHTVIVAQEREFESEGGGDLLAPYVASALTPSVTGWLNPACDYISQTFLRPGTVTKKVKLGGKTVSTQQRTGSAEYCARTGPDAVYATKFRLPKGTSLPDYIVDPDFDKLYRLIQGKEV